MKFKSFLLLMMLFCWFIFAAIGHAATANPTPWASGYTPVVIPFNIYTSTRTPAVRWKAPAGYTIQAASVSARQVSGTTPTMKVRGKDGSFLRYSGTINTAGTVKDLNLTTTPTMTDEAEQTIELIMGGTSPKFSDITLFLFLQRK